MAENMLMYVHGYMIENLKFFSLTNLNQKQMNQMKM